MRPWASIITGWQSDNKALIMSQSIYSGPLADPFDQSQARGTRLNVTRLRLARQLDDGHFASGVHVEPLTMDTLSVEGTVRAVAQIPLVAIRPAWQARSEVPRAPGLAIAAGERVFYNIPGAWLPCCSMVSGTARGPRPHLADRASDGRRNSNLKAWRRSIYQ